MNLSKTTLLALACAVACGGPLPTDPTAAAAPTPTLLSISATQVSVGQPLGFFGGGFVNKGGHVEVEFAGTYLDTDQNQNSVSMRARTNYADGNQATWSNFGPFSVPFSPTGDKLGTFAGSVTAINVMDDGTEGRSAPLTIQLTVGPSLLISSFAPGGTSCASPSERILGGFPYQISVQAVGFTPANFMYSISGEPDAPSRSFRHAASGQTDFFGQDGSLSLEPVPQGLVFYIASFGVTALGTDGQVYGTNYDFGVHSPIEYISNGNPIVAEIEGAVPMSGCMAGGDTGRDVSYTDSQTDEETRSVTYSWDQGFVDSHSSSLNDSLTDGNSTSLQLSNANETGWSANYNQEAGWNAGTSGSLEVGASGTLSADPLGVGTTATVQTQATASVSAGVNHSYSNGGGNQGGQTQSNTVGSDHSSSDTESWAWETSTQDSISHGGSFSWSVSSSTSVSWNFSAHILPGYYGVFYRQTTRIAYPGEVIAYDACAMPTAVATAYFFDYNWAVDMAQGPNCPPFPQSNFPPAQCTLQCASSQ